MAGLALLAQLVGPAVAAAEVTQAGLARLDKGLKAVMVVAQGVVEPALLR